MIINVNISHNVVCFLPITAHNRQEVKRMEMISVADCAAKWGAAERTVRNYCANDRIPGAVLKGKTWFIPEDAVRPARKNKRDELPGTLIERLRAEKKQRMRGGIYHKVQVDMTYNSNHMEGMAENSRLSAGHLPAHAG